MPWQSQIAPYLTGGDSHTNYEASSIHKCPAKSVYAYNRIVGAFGFSSFTKSPFMFADSSYYIVSPNGYWGTPGNWWGGSAIYAAHNNSKSVSGDNGVIGNDASTYLSDQAYNNMVFTDGHVGPQRTLDVFGSEGLQMGAAYDLWFGGN